MIFDVEEICRDDKAIQAPHLIENHSHHATIGIQETCGLNNNHSYWSESSRSQCANCWQVASVFCRWHRWQLGYSIIGKCKMALGKLLILNTCTRSELCKSANSNRKTNVQKLPSTTSSSEQANFPNKPVLVGLQLVSIACNSNPLGTRCNEAPKVLQDSKKNLFVEIRYHNIMELMRMRMCPHKATTPNISSCSTSILRKIKVGTKSAQCNRRRKGRLVDPRPRVIRRLRRVTSTSAVEWY